MRNPRVAAIRVVLDNDEPATRPDERGKPANHLDLAVARDVVKAVRGDDAVKRPEVRRIGQIAHPGLELDIGGARGHRLRIDREGPGIAVERDHARAMPEQVGQCERERATPGADIRPALTGRDAFEAGPQLRDVIGVIHVLPLTGVLQPGRNPVDGQLDEPEDRFARGIVGFE
jgi:hypothetical protein